MVFRDKPALRYWQILSSPVGISTIGVAVGEEVQTIEDVHEPYLIQEGYLQRTPQGRVLTNKAWQTLGIQQTTDNSNQQDFNL